MARLIDNRIAVELDPVVAGLPPVEFVEFVDDGAQERGFTAVPQRIGGGARLDRSIEVMDWFEY